MTVQYEIDVGAALRDVGMARALEVEPEGWLDGAMGALKRFAALPEWREFKTEDFRAWFIGEGYDQPHDHHVWGALTNRAVKAGVIRFTGRYATSVSPKTHAHPVKVWTAS